MNLYDVIKLRKSVRSFLKHPVEPEKLTKILEAARLAPSAKNSQEWRFIIVEAPETRAALAEASYGQQFVGEAPVVIVCCAETDKEVMRCGHYRYTIDCAIAIDHLTLAAAAEGLGTCWIGSFDPVKVRELLQIPETVEVVELLPLGYPKDHHVVEKKRKQLEEIVCYEQWSL